MPLDPLLEAMRGQQLDLPANGTRGVAEARAAATARVESLRHTGLRLYEVERSEVRYIAGGSAPIPVRIYWPSASIDHLPIVVYCHGGGWVLGDLVSHDSTCRAISNRAQTIVVSVDYRKAPEHCFPAAADDCVAAVKWVSKHAGELGGDATRVFVAGESAGGNLAAVAAQDVKDDDEMSLAGQVLIYPVTDHPSAGFESYMTVASDYCVARDVDGMRWFTDLYLGADGKRDDRRFAPLRAKEMGGLPAALVITAEYDPLRDEGEAYAKRLSEAGVPVVVKRFDSVNHGFVELLGILPAADEALDMIVEWLRLRCAETQPS